MWGAVTIGILVIALASISWWSIRRTRSSDDRALDTSRRLLDGIPDAVLGVDSAGTITMANAAAVELTGRTPEELVGRSFIGFVSTDDRADITDRWRRVRFDPTHSGRVVFDLVRRDGTSKLVETSMYPCAEPSDESVLLLRQVGDRDATTEALEQARRRFHHAFHSAPTGMALVTTHDDRLVDVNQTLADMLGLHRRDLVGTTMRQYEHPDDRRRAAAEKARLELGIDNRSCVEKRLLRPDGRTLWAKIQASVVDEDGVEIAITHIEDISEQRRTADALAHAASHDSLTDLPNRASIVAHLGALLARAERDEVAVLFIDLDGFKSVNDTFGHSAGDQLLRYAAHRFRSVMRSGDRLARLGGDEFVVVVDGIRSDTSDRLGPLRPERVAERLQQSMRDPVVIDGYEVQVAASIGVALNRDDVMSADDLLREADAAMYREKAINRRRRSVVPSDPESAFDLVRSESIDRARVDETRSERAEPADLSS